MVLPGSRYDYCSPQQSNWRAPGCSGYVKQWTNGICVKDFSYPGVEVGLTFNSVSHSGGYEKPFNSFLWPSHRLVTRDSWFEICNSLIIDAWHIVVQVKKHWKRSQLLFQLFMSINNGRINRLCENHHNLIWATDRTILISYLSMIDGLCICSETAGLCQLNHA